MKIGITGATGHIGSVLCNALMLKGYEIGALINKTPIDLDIPTYQGSITNEKEVFDFVKNFDAIIHLAADINVSGRSLEKMRNTNINGTKNIINACLKYKINRLIHFSSIAAIDQFPLEATLDETRKLIDHQSLGTQYGKSKSAGEKEVLQAIKKGLNAIIITPTSVMGPYDKKPSILGQSLIDMYSNSLPALVKGGQDWVDVRDICEGTIAALEKGEIGEKYLLGSEFLTIQQIAQSIGEIYQRKVPTIVLPFWVARLGVPFEKIKAKRSGKPNGFTNEALTALKYSNLSISHEKASRELGYSPRSARESIKDMLDWFILQGRIV